jgi:hypothetical protein
MKLDQSGQIRQLNPSPSKGLKVNQTTAPVAEPNMIVFDVPYRRWTVVRPEGGSHVLNYVQEGAWSTGENIGKRRK